MARPSPVPPVERARAGSARQKRLNTRPASPGRSPTPWSRTATATAVSFTPNETVTGCPSPCSTALTTRLRRIRSTRRGSTSAMHGTPGSWRTSSLPRRPARVVVDSTTRAATERRSVASRSSAAAPASNRLISSRSVRSASNRSISACSSSAVRATCGAKSPRESCSSSPAIRMVVSGVRSSWETSELKRCWTRERFSSWRIWRCRLSAMPLNAAASRAMSSSPRAVIRSLSRPEESRSATSAARRTGSTTTRVTT